MCLVSSVNRKRYLYNLAETSLKQLMHEAIKINDPEEVKSHLGFLLDSLGSNIQTVKNK